MSNQLSAADFIGALKTTGGLIAPAARRLGVSRQTVYRATQNFPTVQQALEDSRAELLDLCEGHVFKAATEGDVRTAQWVLERLGRDRGYVVRTETDGPGFSARDITTMSDDELAQKRRELGLL